MESIFMIDMAERGIEAGNVLVREILKLGIVSKYRMAKDLKVSDTTVYNWLKGSSSPDQDNYARLRDYRLYIDKVKRLPEFK